MIIITDIVYKSQQSKYLAERLMPQKVMSWEVLYFFLNTTRIYPNQ